MFPFFWCNDIPIGLNFFGWISRLKSHSEKSLARSNLRDRKIGLVELWVSHLLKIVVLPMVAVSCVCSGFCKVENYFPVAINKFNFVNFFPFQNFQGEHLQEQLLKFNSGEITSINFDSVCSQYKNHCVGY